MKASGWTVFGIWPDTEHGPPGCFHGIPVRSLIRARPREEEEEEEEESLFKEEEEEGLFKADRRMRRRRRKVYSKLT